MKEFMVIMLILSLTTCTLLALSRIHQRLSDFWIELGKLEKRIRGLEK